MSTQPKRLYSLEEYFELERTSEERWEYFDGEVFCMSGVSPNHSRIERNAITSLNNKLGSRGCEVFTADMRIRVPAAPPYRYADLSVLYDEAVFEKIGGVEALTNPVIIVEVLSPQPKRMIAATSSLSTSPFPACESTCWWHSTDLTSRTMSKRQERTGDTKS